VGRSDDPVTPDRLLRRLEVVRQRLSIRWCGSPGAFAGYDELEIASPTAVTEGIILFTARLIHARAGCHVVELMATLTPAAGQVSGEVGPSTLVRGRGTSLEVNVSRVAHRATQVVQSTRERHS
jgi:hypothetical protein